MRIFEALLFDLESQISNYAPATQIIPLESSKIIFFRELLIKKDVLLIDTVDRAKAVLTVLAIKEKIGIRAGVTVRRVA
jgi:hypothetical protein